MGRTVWKVVVKSTRMVGAIIGGICRALGMVAYVLCAVIETMAVIFLLGSIGSRR